ncbi:hypothetical protein UUU_43090 [Klebsiella pneumoniae subsp. pneumoniae DSM 30104 = JCM 1662 = NBRC 14940]|nr:hypothetical protein UUU_43090 [Klebsiella pneumoniae subsp. pneumoniae DSM 30104 = JCM 1662 = NBRC 14940]
MKQRGERAEERITAHFIDMLMPGHIDFYPAFALKMAFQSNHLFH